MNDRAPTIGVYEYIDYGNAAEVYRPYDPRFPEVAARLIALIEANAPGVRVEHVGSSAIPGCAGKGVIDLLARYPAGGLAAARDTIDALGFQRQANRDPFPEERPLRVGTIEHDGDRFRIHVHVIAAGDAEAIEQIGFRDALRADPELLAEYDALKRQVVAAGVVDNVAYNQGKEAFIRRVLQPIRGAATPGGSGDNEMG
ncbi:MAG: GrpB family protein [Thermomicrobiales bacterium]|nr:GrpB family protein [Thermomicrobiales bacterium]